MSNLKSKINPYAVEILSSSDSTDDLVTKEYRVFPSFIPVTPSSDTPSYGAGTGGESTRLQDRRDAKKFLEEQGVPFTSSESFARYIPSGSRLVVRNTQSAIDTIDTIIEGEMGLPPNQVEIESKFVEISQNNLNELGFDWMLGPLSIGGGMYGNGGTVGLNQETSGNYYSNFHFNQIGQNPVTAGTRSGVGTNLNSAVTANSIDALIAQMLQGANLASPGIFGIAGVFTNPQFQMVIRALSQQKGVDLMSAPKVTTKSGNSAIIKLIREFPYPSEFDPPQFDEKEERIVPVSMATTECWDTGFSVSGEVHLNGSEVVFQISPEISALAENRQSSDDANDVPRPSFAVSRIDAGFGAALGDSVLAGVITQQAEEGNGQADRVLVIFLRADAHFVVSPGGGKANVE